MILDYEKQHLNGHKTELRKRNTEFRCNIAYRDTSWLQVVSTWYKKRVSSTYGTCKSEAAKFEGLKFLETIARSVYADSNWIACIKLYTWMSYTKDPSAQRERASGTQKWSTIGRTRLGYLRGPARIRHNRTIKITGSFTGTVKKLQQLHCIP